MIKEKRMEIIDKFHSDLKVVKELVYDKCGFELTEPELNSESVAYGACSFRLNGRKIQHRVSKITPTKEGQFVTIWRRDEIGITEPFHISDDLDFIIITSKSEDNLGQFIFPKLVLLEEGIITSDDKDGKRGMRVYPPWDNPTNRQAQKTQSWQNKYFLTIRDQSLTDLNFIKKLFT